MLCCFWFYIFRSSILGLFFFVLVISSLFGLFNSNFLTFLRSNFWFLFFLITLFCLFILLIWLAFNSLGDFLRARSISDLRGFFCGLILSRGIFFVTVPLSNREFSFDLFLIWDFLSRRCRRTLSLFHGSCVGTVKETIQQGVDLAVEDLVRKEREPIVVTNKLEIRTYGHGCDLRFRVA